MQVQTLKPDQVAFNPTTGTFTALVVLREDGRFYRYPCDFAAPMTMPPAIAAHRLTQMAKQQHAQQGSLRSMAPDPDKTGPDQLNLPRVA